LNRLSAFWAKIEPAEKRYLLILLILSLAIRLVYVFTVDLIPPDISYVDMDAVEYDHLGWSLAQGHGFVYPDGNPTTFRFPGYPYLLGLIYLVFGHHHLAVLLIQAFLGVFAPLFIYLTAKELFPERISRVAGLIAAGYPIFIWYLGWIMSENLFFFLLCLLIYLTVSLKKRPTWGRLVWLGVIIGILSLTRGVGLPFIGLIPVYIFFYFKGNFGERVIRAAAVGLIAASLLVPWTIRNRVVFGRWMLPSSEAGAVMWMGLNRVDLTKMYIVEPAFDYLKRDGGNATSEGFYKALSDTNSFGLRAINRLFEMYYPKEPLPATELEAMDRLSAKCRVMLTAHPGVWAAKSFAQIFRFWHVLDERGRYLYGYGFILPFFLVGAWMTRRRFWELLPLYGFLLVMYALGIPFDTAGRYRMPFEGVLIIIAAVALERFLSRFRRKYLAYSLLIAFFAFNYYLKLHSLDMRLAIRSVAGALGFRLIEM
jgi:4-amino-4-deoxy-L-arabinose transferase-like glycosyltransferase